jgi:hypothetical protein
VDTTLALLSTGLALTIAAGAIALACLRGRRGGAFRHFCCPASRQRLRYQARKAGRAALCPNCLGLATLRRPGHPRPVAGVL